VVAIGLMRGRSCSSTKPGRWARQAQALFEWAREAGARVLLLGDVSQHESVGRGAVLRGLADACGALDMRDTRRARETWLREVAQDLRAGFDTREAPKKSRGPGR
jgi:hypothetical protein